MALFENADVTVVKCACAHTLLLLCVYLRESDPKFHEFAVKTEISDFFISGQERPFGNLFTKITIKLSKEFLFSRNSAKREMPYLLRSRHEILPRFGAFSKRSGRKTAQRTEMIF